MTILHLSDTHGRHRELDMLPEADVLVHSGDFTLGGSDTEVLDFLEWLCDLPYRHKVFVAGNHDDCMLDATLEGLPYNVHYLADSGIIIDGVRFYGAPMLATMVGGKICMVEHYEQLQPADVLVTHRPPLGILDGDDNLHVGSSLLLERIKTLKPHMHLFGHEHSSYGTYRWGYTLFSNASICDQSYMIINCPRPLVISPSAW